MLDSGTMTELEVEKANHVRRRRLELRPLKVFSEKTKSEIAGAENGTLAGDDRSPKKTRPKDREIDLDSSRRKNCSKEQASLVSVSLDSGDDVVLSGTSSVRDKVRAVKGNPPTVSCWSHGSVSLIGRRRQMEDAVAAELSFLTRGAKEYHFFGVYDGHGGSHVAQACRDRLHRLLVKAVEEGDDKVVEKRAVNWEKVLMESFGKMDDEVCQSGSALAMMGSTAVVAVVGEEVVVVANCGDSRAVISRDGAAMVLSNDHKPDRPDELNRIEGSGGRVINWNGQRVLGVLATSRSLGDQYLKPFVISEPEVLVSKRTDKDEFLILASDGLWEVVSNEDACQVVRCCLHGRARRKSQEVLADDEGSNGIKHGSRAAEAAAVLAELAMARGSLDNISIIVVGLKKHGKHVVQQS